jgi:hypothetical protein
MMRREWEGGKPKRITGVGSERFGGEDRGAELNRLGVISGGGEGAVMSGFMFREVTSLGFLFWEGGGSGVVVD